MRSAGVLESVLILLTTSSGTNPAEQDDRPTHISHDWRSGMILKTSLTAVVAAGLLATGPLAQQPTTTSPKQTPPKPAVVSLIGCVERVPTPPVRGTTQPAPQGTAYKLVDVQPGTGTAANLKADSQFLLTVATSLKPPIDLGKFQNQWVEVTGTISPAPPPKVNPPATTPPTGEAATAPLPTFTTTAVKVVSTECK